MEITKKLNLWDWLHIVVKMLSYAVTPATCLMMAYEIRWLKEEVSRVKNDEINR